MPRCTAIQSTHRHTRNFELTRPCPASHGRGGISLRAALPEHSTISGIVAVCPAPSGLCTRCHDQILCMRRSSRQVTYTPAGRQIQDRYQSHYTTVVRVGAHGRTRTTKTETKRNGGKWRGREPRTKKVGQACKYRTGVEMDTQRKDEDRDPALEGDPPFLTRRQRHDQALRWSVRVASQSSLPLSSKL